MRGERGTISGVGQGALPNRVGSSVIILYGVDDARRYKVDPTMTVLAIWIRCTVGKKETRQEASFGSSDSLPYNESLNTAMHARKGNIGKWDYPKRGLGGKGRGKDGLKP